MRRPPPVEVDHGRLLAEGRAALAVLVRLPRARTPDLEGVPAASGLAEAHAEGRALAFRGDRDQVRRWMQLAKWGSDAARLYTRRQGPLYSYQLVVTREGDQSPEVLDEGGRFWFHIVVPAEGLAPQGVVGRHEAWLAGERWWALSDHLTVGQDFRLYKRSNTQSVHRQWGRDWVIEDIARMARLYRQATGVLVGIGDISHVTGGQMSDHLTHRRGVDADLYTVDYPIRGERWDFTRPQMIWHHQEGDRSIWSTGAGGAGRREVAERGGLTRTGRRLEVLADACIEQDRLGYFVHNDANLLEAYDQRAMERVYGRRYLHAHNRGYWPPHRDHVHLRWADGAVEMVDPPRP